ncbi:nucleoside/nucleotide kinase family protein [Kineosporia succinea]|uniref:Uridine kinase n=1 Tax=Kineosporia succinea TaxID=84632 RepID=A0ABT9P4H0_9ACTN|nr:hypothetical protein [Kineosporia succinea]MDP9827372.1 hypothetical protein [Kineosporia succinea]
MDERPRLRLAVDGPVQADTARLADVVAGSLSDLAVPVARVSTRDFLRGRSVRLEYGHDDPDSVYDLYYDFPALRREVLDALAPDGRHTWLPRLRDPETDRSVRVSPEPAPPGTVAVVDGRFLARDDVRDGFDLIVHLDVSEGALGRRLPADEAKRTSGAWARYLTEDAPAEYADLVVRFDHPDRPALKPG